MASRSLAYRKQRRRGVPDFMGRASILAQPRAEFRAVWKNLAMAEYAIGGAQPVVLSQQGRQWCWAAISQALLALDGQAKTQQAIVNRHTGKNCPITNGSSGLSGGDCTAAVGCSLKCDDPHDLQVAIAGWGLVLKDYYLPEHPDALAKLRKGLTAGPVAARIKFREGDAHAILITACTGAGDDPTVRYLSPIYSDLAPFPVQPDDVPWLSLIRKFPIAGSKARLSHIYPRV